MDSIPIEIRVMIVRLLPHDGDDREAFIAACPRWKNAVELEESLWVRSLTYDPAGILGLNTDQISELFDGTRIRRRQLLHEIRFKCFLNADELPDRCCILESGWEGEELSECLDDLTFVLEETYDRAIKAGLELPPLRLAFMTATNGLEKGRRCSTRTRYGHKRRAIKEKLLCDYEIRSGMGMEVKISGVEELFFRNHGLFRHLYPRELGSFIWKLRPDLRVLRLEFDEDILWSRVKKDIWRGDVLLASGWAKAVKVEELHVHIGCHSPRNEFLQHSHYWVGAGNTDFATNLFASLSASEHLTILRLTGQLRVPPSVFDCIDDEDPFWTLEKFYLAIAPDTYGGDWYFIKDETEHAWTKAAANPEWANRVKLTEEGVFPQDPDPGPSGTGEADYYAWSFKPGPVKRFRTLPNDATMGPLLRGAARAVGKMEDIEEFSLCLGDNFDKDDCEYPFVPPFITRKFEMHFVKPAEGKGSPTLTFKLGQKVDHWRPTEDVLEAWRAAAGEDSGLQISFAE